MQRYQKQPEATGRGIQVYSGVFLIECMSLSQDCISINCGISLHCVYSHFRLEFAF